MSQAEIQQLAVNFLQGKIPDHRGRTVDDYLNFTEEQMENDHEWIQWAFPIDTASIHNGYAGLYFKGIHKKYGKISKLVFTQNALLQKYLESIGVNALSFYNQYPNANKFFTVVSSPYNHHVKRISRVIKHLRLTGRHHLARLILAELTKLIHKYPQNFSASTVALWYSYAFDDIRNWES